MSSGISAKGATKTIARLGLIAIAEPGSGGIFQYTQAMIDALAEQNLIQVVVFTSSDEFNFHGLEIRAIDLTGSKARKIYQMATLLAGVRPFSNLCGLSGAFIDDIDVFVSPIASGFPHFWTTKPYLITVHDMQERYYPEFFRWHERLRRRLINRPLASKAAAVLCESEYVKNDITRFLQVEKSKVHVCPAPPPRLPAESSASELVATLPREFIFYPAQFWPHKNHLRLIEAFHACAAEFPNVHLVLSGGKQSAFDPAMAAVARLGLKNRVHYLGYLSYPDLMCTYRSATALIMPSLFESISIPVYEAFELGTPVCCSNAVGLVEQVGNAGLLFDPTNVSQISDRIREILRDVELRKELVRRGRDRVRKLTHFAYGETIARIALENANRR